MIKHDSPLQSIAIGISPIVSGAPVIKAYKQPNCFERLTLLYLLTHARAGCFLSDLFFSQVLGQLVCQTIWKEWLIQIEETFCYRRLVKTTVNAVAARWAEFFPLTNTHTSGKKVLQLCWKNLFLTTNGTKIFRGGSGCEMSGTGFLHALL